MPGLGNAAITCGTLTLVLLPNDPHSRITEVVPDLFGAVVGGSVVDDDDFEVSEVLCQDAADRIAHRMSLVVQRNDD